MIDISFYTLSDRTENELYILIDKHLRPLPKNSDGTINTEAKGFQHNDVDALRHAYVSGIYTMEYNESVAAFLGKVQEKFPIMGSVGTSGSNREKARNMDFWNNAVGRKYGKKSKTKEELFQNLLKALKNGELIIDLNDLRKYPANKDSVDKELKGRIIVLKENETGENIQFLDTETLMIFSRENFLAKIKNGEYSEDYEIRVVNGKEIPTSKRDGTTNLG